MTITPRYPYFASMTRTHSDKPFGPPRLMDAELVGGDGEELVGRELILDNVRIRITRYVRISHRYAYVTIDAA